MKKDKNSCKKNQESTIGKIIYGFLLFMPLIAIGVTCGYAMFNKNAYVSHTPTNSINFVDISNQNSKSGNTLYFRYDTTQITNQYTQQYFYNWISIDFEDYIYQYTQYVDFNPDGIQLYSTGIIRLHNPNNDQWSAYNTNLNQFQGIWGVTLNNFSLTLKEDISNPFIGGSAKIQVAYPLEQTLDQIFYQAVDTVTESPLFSWATNSVIYTTINATCTQLSITAPFIPLLLTYWLIISVIYILYDIALIMLHIFHKKVHCIEDAV